MSPTQKLEKDPYYSTGDYLIDIQDKLRDNDIDEASKIINEARLFDARYYEGDLPRYNEIATMFEELGNFQGAKEILLDVKSKSKDFFQRAYLDLYEINKKLGKEDENFALLKEASKENEEAFCEYGYKKLVEMLIERKEFAAALRTLEIAKEKQIQMLPKERKAEIESLSLERRNNFFPTVEDYHLSLVLKEVIARSKN